jgi:putative SOS response-associated peptidase YedK
MCYYTQQMATIDAVKRRFNAEVDNEEAFLESDYIKGFKYPNIPVILDTEPAIITTDHTWGLMPSWADSSFNRRKTLNARIETLDKRNSYKNITQNRCLIIASGYYEWHWLDKQGKSKEKYELKSFDDDIFTFAGLYTSWTNPFSGLLQNTFTMVTTEGNEIMKYVHNSKSIKSGNIHDARMPIMLRSQDESAWLDQSVDISEFAFPYEGNINAINLNPNIQYGLF